MHTGLIRHARLATLAALVGLLLVAACTPATTSEWRFGPSAPAAVPSPSAATGSAEPSGSSEPSLAPGASPSAPAGGTPNNAFTFVKAEPCPESRFECITLSVAKDHFAAAGGPTWDVTFAIQRATGERRGTFVVITGGPGSSGIASADGYTDYYAASMTEDYDIVFMDQRGIGLSGPIQCVDAAAAYYRSTASPQDPAERDEAAAAAQAFATDCIAEAGVAEADLPFYATVQAVEDLEAIRAYLEVDKMHLYGESYGTQYIQYYAAAHPDRIETLYLDGPVDLTIDGPTYYVEAARSAEDTLRAVLDACTADELCVADIAGGDALAAYDELAERLAGGPISFEWTTATGTTETRQLTTADLENAAFGYIYSPGDRFILERAVAAASRDNLVPIARLAYGSIGIDPETLLAEDDPSWSDALYYAVECQDYAFFPGDGDPAARLAAWVEHADANGIGDLRLGASYFGDVPCLYWPTATTSDVRPAPLLDPPYPVFVLTSTTDPATPIANGMRIYARLDDAYFFQALGGPHVIFAWGEPCPDEIVYDYLETGVLPPTRVTSCVWAVADPYVPIAPTTVADYDDGLEVGVSVIDQLLNSDDYLSRLGADPLPVGCDFGGTLTYTPTDTGTSFDLAGCEFTDEMPLTGTGASDDEAGTLELDLTLPDGSLRVEQDADGIVSVEGTYLGDPVDLETAS